MLQLVKVEAGYRSAAVEEFLGVRQQLTAAEEQDSTAERDQVPSASIFEQQTAEASILEPMRHTPGNFICPSFNEKVPLLCRGEKCYVCLITPDGFAR